MLLDELVEIAGQNLPGQPPRTGVDRHLRHLQQQAFAQVARAVGYESQSKFSTEFHKAFGVLLTEYRKAQKK